MCMPRSKKESGATVLTYFANCPIILFRVRNARPAPIKSTYGGAA